MACVSLFVRLVDTSCVVTEKRFVVPGLAIKTGHERSCLFSLKKRDRNHLAMKTIARKIASVPKKLPARPHR